MEKPLQPSSSPSEKEAARTILFADVCKSTEIYEQHGDVKGLHIVGGAVSVLSEVTTAHNGTVVKTIGDEVMSLFESPADACEAAEAMHEAVQEDNARVQWDLHIKVGFHCGDVLLETDDVYGDAVNVAARMVGFAEAEQVITTQSTLDHLPRALQEHTRRLGQVSVRGKEQPMLICEYLWKSDVGARTTVAAPSYAEMVKQTSSKLMLHYEDAAMELDAHDASFTLGRSQESSLTVEHPRVSRRHAHIEFVNGFFVFTDRSTNGTYVHMGEEEVVVHRDQLRLMHKGRLSLGQALSENQDQAIHFVCNYQRD